MPAGRPPAGLASTWAAAPCSASVLPVLPGRELLLAVPPEERSQRNTGPVPALLRRR